MLHRLVLTALTLALLGAASSPAQAARARQRHDGFFLRLAAGLGFASAEPEGDVTLSGLGWGFGVGIGGIIADDLALHAELSGTDVPDPKIESGGVEGDLDGSMSAYGVGVGVTYYLMPTNLYLSGSLGVAQGNLSYHVFGGINRNDDTDAGFVLTLMVGKEWWVAPEWGIGIAGRFCYLNLPIDSTDDSWSVIAANVLFSATFN